MFPLFSLMESVVIPQFLYGKLKVQEELLLLSYANISKVPIHRILCHFQQKGNIDTQFVVILTNLCLAPCKMLFRFHF